MNVSAEIKCPNCKEVVTLQSRDVEYKKIKCPECGGWIPIERHLSAQPGYTSIGGTVSRDHKKIRMSKKERRRQRGKS